MKHLIVIGGGAAGLMAAIRAAEGGAKVTVLEHNEQPGRKLLASGNGKCNLSNRGEHDRAYNRAATERISAWFSSFGPDETLAFFHACGLMTKEKDGWVYPQSEQSQAVLSCLLDELLARSVTLRTRAEVVGIEETEAGFLVRTSDWQYVADAVLLACGSPASDVRGASNLAERIAASLQIPFVPFLPALVPLRVQGDFCGRWAGARLSASVTLLLDGTAVQTERGTVQLAAYGISGIPVFDLSGRAVRARTTQEVQLLLDCFPDQSREALVSHIRTQEALHPGRGMQAILSGMIPAQLAGIIAERGGDAATCAALLKEFPLVITSAGPLHHAQVCSGGIPLSALDDRLAVRGHPGLFLAGEAIDVDGRCGGFNLQWAWTSGHLAGAAAAAYLARLQG